MMINTNVGQTGEPVPSGIRARSACKSAGRLGVAQNNKHIETKSCSYSDVISYNLTSYSS